MSRERSLSPMNSRYAGTTSTSSNSIVNINTNRNHFHSYSRRPSNSGDSWENERTIRNDPSKTLFVGRLNINTTEATLRNYFKQFGTIESLVLVHDHVTRSSKRYAFIQYRHYDDANHAYDQANGTYLDGFRILVDREKGRSKNWNSSSRGHFQTKERSNTFHRRNLHHRNFNNYRKNTQYEFDFDHKSRSRSRSRSRSQPWSRQKRT